MILSKFKKNDVVKVVNRQRPHYYNKTGIVKVVEPLEFFSFAKRLRTSESFTYDVQIGDKIDEFFSNELIAIKKYPRHKQTFIDEY